MFSVFFLALALSMDAFAVAFSYGLIICKDIGKNAIKLGLATGIGQFVFPIIGWAATNSVHQYIEDYDHWIAFFVFLALGLNVIYGAFKNDDEKEELPHKFSFKMLVFLGVATSVDAAVSGISLYFIPIPIILSASIIGIICFIITVAGFYLSCYMKKLPTKLLQTLSGIILILLGFKILYEHLS